MEKNSKRKFLKKVIKKAKGEHVMPDGKMMKDEDMPMNKYKNLKKK